MRRSFAMIDPHAEPDDIAPRVPNPAGKSASGLPFACFVASILLHAGAALTFVNVESALPLRGEQEIPIEIIADASRFSQPQPSLRPAEPSVPEQQEPPPSVISSAPMPSPGAEIVPLAETSSSTAPEPDDQTPPPELSQPVDSAELPPSSPTPGSTAPTIESSGPAEMPTAPTSPEPSPPNPNPEISISASSSETPSPEIPAAEAAAPFLPPAAPSPLKSQVSAPLPIAARSQPVPERQDVVAERRRQEELQRRGHEEAEARKREQAQAKKKAEAEAKRRATAEAKRRRLSSTENPTQPVAGVPAAKTAADPAEYRSSVLRRLASLKHYPESARARGVEGDAVVSFTLDNAGRVVSARITRSSGQADIDAETLAMVRRASPFPPPPSAAARSFSAPIDFRLD
jgi:TonB family protein